MKHRLKAILVALVVVFLIVITTLNLILTIQAREVESVKNTEQFRVLRNLIDEQPTIVHGINGKDAEPVTPEQIYAQVENYCNSHNQCKGETGDKGEKGDSIQGTIGEKGDSGADGLTPLIRCNVVKNRWEYRYNDADNWFILNETPTACALGSILLP